MNAKSGLGWYHGWNIVTVCVLSCIALNALPINAFSLFLRDWSTDLHTPVSTFQIGIGGLGVVSALLSPFAGMLVDKFPVRFLIGFGLAIAALVCFGISVMTAPWQFILLYAVPLPVAICTATLLPANAVVSRWFVRRRGLALATVSVGLGLGGVIMPLVVTYVMPEIGWRGVWRIAALVVAVVLLPLALLVIRDRPRERDGQHYLSGDAATGGVHGHSPASGGDTLRWRDILARRNFWLLVITYIPMLAVYGGVGQNLGPIAESHGIGASTAGALVSAFNLSTVVFVLAAGLLSDRFGNRLPLAAFAILAAMGGVFVSLADGVAMLGIGAVLAGIGNTFWPLVASAIALEFGAERMGRAFGLLTLFLPATSVTPFAAAKSQELTGSYAPALLVMAALALIAGLLCGLLMREKRGGATTKAIEDAPVPAI